MVGPAILILAAAFRIASRYIKPPPPSTLTMATAFAGSPYALLAQHYQDVLASDGVALTLTLVPPLGASENLTRLRYSKQAVDVGLVQDGMATRAKGQRDERLPEYSPRQGRGIPNSACKRIHFAAGVANAAARASLLSVRLRCVRRIHPRFSR